MCVFGLKASGSVAKMSFRVFRIVKSILGHRIARTDNDREKLFLKGCGRGRGLGRMMDVGIERPKLLSVLNSKPQISQYTHIYIDRASSNGKTQRWDTRMQIYNCHFNYTVA